MEVIFHHSNEYGSLSEQRLLELEKQIGYHLPEDYRRFLLAHNGGVPEPNAFFVESIGNTSVEVFFGIHEGPEYAQMLPALPSYRERLPSAMLPIGRDEIGNVLCISLSREDRGNIYLGELHRQLHSDHPFDKDVLYRLADNFSAFLNSLQPASPPIEYIPTALEIIVQSGDKEELFEVLAERGPDAYDDLGRPIIQLAASYGQMEFVKLLVDRGANPAGLVAIAARKGDEVLLDYMLSIGTSLEERSKNALNATPLIVAAMHGHANVVRKLLAHGVNVHATNDAGISALEWARRKGFTDIIKMLETAS